mgnify:CR=1 FL=1
MKKILSVILMVIFAFFVSAPALAATFVPSVEQKQAPEIVVDSSGNAATITDREGNSTSVSSGAIIITPLSQADQAEDADMAATMETAYAQLKKSTSLSGICSNFNDVLSEIDASLTEDDMVARDLFDISLYGDAKQLLSNGGTIRITLATTLSQDTPRMVLHYQSDSWNALDPENVTANADGSTTITVDNLSPFAIVVPTSAITGEEVTSPQTSDDSTDVWTMVAAAAAGLATGFFTIAFKRKPISEK